MYGAVDETGMEFGVHRGGRDYANSCYFSKGKSPNPIWRNEGKFSEQRTAERENNENLLTNYLLPLPQKNKKLQVVSQSQYSLARAQQSFKSLVQIHEKNGKRISLPLRYKFE